MISERKFDDSFPFGQFCIHRFGLAIRLDRNKHGGEIMLYAREDITIKLLSSEANSSEGFYVEMNQYKKKWLINYSYNPEKENISKHIATVRKRLNSYSTKYEYLIVLGDLIVEVQSKCMMDFCESYNFRGLFTGLTCFENP